MIWLIVRMALYAISAAVSGMGWTFVSLDAETAVLTLDLHGLVGWAASHGWGAMVTGALGFAGTFVASRYASVR